MSPSPSDKALSEARCPLHGPTPYNVSVGREG